MTVLDHRLLLAQDYALINPLQVDSSLWHDLPLVPLSPKELAAKPVSMPRLLALREMTEHDCLQLLQRVHEQARRNKYPYFSALIVSSRTTRELSAQLAERMIVRVRDRRNAILRYFDPRVFRHLRWILNKTQMDSLLRSVAVWTWLTPDGNWTQHQCANAASPSRLRLTDKQWEALQRLRLLHRCLEQMAIHVPKTLNDDAIAQHVDALLHLAYTEYGLRDGDDRSLYALQAARFHPRIGEHPEIRIRLCKVQKGDISYVGACADLSDDALSRFAGQLASNVPPTSTSGMSS
ncbi:DUF4123 domain-containing protein [Lysobacter sp. H23M47]|uniref:DUF4123 domain-containing protein n=1 Tax=Lysobacter sp. H23M47 TaxID=2781024 RepID=UPI0018804FC5|nr:DUF4123 domain-containing protein [Lysobacter sp. H23M47]QOW24778.1 DUF4123 domain-containing protein [Lysobacter sp. H23M47]